MRKRTIAIVVAAACVTAVAAGALLLGAPPRVASAALPPTTSRAQSGSVAHSSTFTPLSTSAVAALPEARYNAVIPGLIPFSEANSTAISYTTYSVPIDTPIYGVDHAHPVARFAAKNFLSLPTVVVAVRSAGAWTMVLTPARQELPSEHGGNAPAQTAGWVRTDSIVKAAVLDKHIVVSASAQTLAIETTAGTVLSSYKIGVGTPTTPSPLGVTGYIQAKYLDASQGEATYPIQLTSLHSAAADNPYGGTDGGLIALHWGIVGDGVVSHGCLRLTPAAITAVNLLPVGTVVSIEK